MTLDEVTQATTNLIINSESSKQENWPVCKNEKISIAKTDFRENDLK